MLIHVPTCPLLQASTAAFAVVVVVAGVATDGVGVGVAGAAVASDFRISHLSSL